ncbi:hypothetical protein Hanom_Chr16g01494351 [Helianthus anomalus]
MALLSPFSSSCLPRLCSQLAAHDVVVDTKSRVCLSSAPSHLQRSLIHKESHGFKVLASASVTADSFKENCREGDGGWRLNMKCGGGVFL